MISSSPADVLKAIVYLWNCITSADRRRIKRETDNKARRWKEKETDGQASLSLSLSSSLCPFPTKIDRRKCIGKASGRERMYKCDHKLFVSHARMMPMLRRRSRTHETGEITGSSFNDRDSLLSSVTYRLRRVIRKRW